MHTYLELKVLAGVRVHKIKIKVNNGRKALGLDVALVESWRACRRCQPHAAQHGMSAITPNGTQKTVASLEG